MAGTARERIEKIGRVLSSANEKALRQAADAIERVLAQLGLASEQAPLSKADVQSGVMVALYPPQSVAAGLAQPGGEAAGDLHVTLAYLGDASELADPQRLATLVAAFAATCPPLAGEISGTGRFSAGPVPVTYASVDVPCLSEVRDDLCESLLAAGYILPSEHGFQPHMTLAYDDRALSLPAVPLSFDTVTLAIAGQRLSFPLTGAPHDHDLRKDAMYPLAVGDPVRWSNADLSLGRSGVITGQAVDEDGAWVYDVLWSDGSITSGARQYELRNVRDLRDLAARTQKMERTVPLWKDDSAQVVYGVVLQPGVTDSQGDRVSAGEIEQAAHRYLVESRKSDVQHTEQEAPVDVVESYIAPMDMVVAGRKVLKGAWVMGVHVADQALWQRVVKQEITGFSIGGTAIRA